MTEQLPLLGSTPPADPDSPEVIPPPSNPHGIPPGRETGPARETRKIRRRRPGGERSDEAVETAGQEAGHRATETLPAVSTDVGGVIALIREVALSPNGDVEKLARLMDLEDRWRKREAEAAFNAAKGRILNALAGIKIIKNKAVTYDKGGGFKYAPLEEIDKHLGPLLAREAMDLSYSDETQPDGKIMIRGRLRHLPSGHYEDSFMAAPVDTSGGKNAIQAIGSTNMYLRRYVASNIFNIVVIGDDDDGMGGPIDAAQVKNIKELMIGAGVNETRVLRYAKTESIEAIPQREYRKVVVALEEIIKAKESASGKSQ